MRRPRMLGGEAIVLVVVVSMALVAGCVSGDRDDPVGRPRPSTVGTAHDDPPAPESAGGPALLPGMPPPLDPGDVYAADRRGAAARDPVVGPAPAVGRERPGQQPHPDQPAHRQAGPARPRLRSV